jgi:diaminohydroxyphosphoribosylaminopyrimidine deaminase/5-amino-6-(5-phosphoribosylamino)uracil reductase
VPLWIVTTDAAPLKTESALVAAGVSVLRTADRSGQVDLAAALKRLGERGITRVLVEGGPILSATLLRHDLVDEAIVVRSDRMLGVGAIDALEGLPLTALTESPRLEAIERRMAGTDSLTRYFRG